MSGQRPSIEQRDRCLDELASAYAQGRLSGSQFAARSDQVLRGASLRDLDEALAGVQAASMPYSSPAYQPRPCRPHEPVVAPSTQRGRATRRQFFLAGGVAAFVLVTGGGIVAAMAHQPYSTQPVPQPEGSAPRDYLRDEHYGILDPYTTGVMSRVKITNDTVVLLAKPAGQLWQSITLTVPDRVQAQQTEPGSNIFDSREANVSVISEVVQLSETALGDVVKSAEFVRPAPDVGVQIIVTGARGGQVIWDAWRRQILETKIVP